MERAITTLYKRFLSICIVIAKLSRELAEIRIGTGTVGRGRLRVHLQLYVEGRGVSHGRLMLTDTTHSYRIGSES